MSDKTFIAKTMQGDLVVQIKRYVFLCGMDGFVLHRPVSNDCTGTDDEGWAVSHISGFRVAASTTLTAAEVIARAERRLQDLGCTTPAKLDEVIKEAQEKLEKKQNTKELCQTTTTAESVAHPQRNRRASAAPKTTKTATRRRSARGIARPGAKRPK